VFSRQAPLFQGVMRKSYKGPLGGQENVLAIRCCAAVSEWMRSAQLPVDIEPENPHTPCEGSPVLVVRTVFVAEHLPEYVCSY